MQEAGACGAASSPGGRAGKHASRAPCGTATLHMEMHDAGACGSASARQRAKHEQRAPGDLRDTQMQRIRMQDADACGAASARERRVYATRTRQPMQRVSAASVGNTRALAASSPGGRACKRAPGVRRGRQMADAAHPDARRWCLRSGISAGAPRICNAHLAAHAAGIRCICGQHPCLGRILAGGQSRKARTGVRRGGHGARIRTQGPAPAKRPLRRVVTHANAPPATHAKSAGCVLACIVPARTRPDFPHCQAAPAAG